MTDTRSNEEIIWQALDKYDFRIGASAGAHVHAALSAAGRLVTPEHDAAATRLVALARQRLEMYEGEWGCGHYFDEALADPSCESHEGAREVVALALVMGKDVAS